jgi:hypothetical protein
MLVQKNTGRLGALNATVRCGDADCQARERVAGSAAGQCDCQIFQGTPALAPRSVLGGRPAITAQTD